MWYFEHNNFPLRHRWTQSRVSMWRLDGGEDDEEMCEEHAAGDIHEASAFAAGERRTDSLSTPPR